MNNICVFAGSNPGVAPDYMQAAETLAKRLAGRGVGLVYGGSRFGLMGKLADTMLAANGEVVGVMPKGLFRGEMIHTGLTKFCEVNNMHERKAKMYELSDAFIALPGGYGTFEELFEVLSWSQLGIHRKPIGLLNVNGFYTPLVAMIRQAIDSGFVRESQIGLFVVDENPEALLDKLDRFERPPFESKWNELD
ncbi:TIGR00730 family Rossman fold protein [Paenibacillus sp. GYB003]|uniref:LOG family protein n=1 Tax=Paenibacillus sp. GYB003 TaxID=2994392 RepID=UPI002F961E9E